MRKFLIISITFLLLYFSLSNTSIANNLSIDEVSKNDGSGCRSSCRSDCPADQYCTTDKATGKCKCVSKKPKMEVDFTNSVYDNDGILVD